MRAIVSLLLVGCAVLNPGSNVPAPKAMTPPTPTALTWQRVKIVDAIARGRVTSVKENWDYGTSCGIIERLQGCREQSAWEVEVQGTRTWEFWAFPPPGNYVPIAPDMQAIFLLERVWIVPWYKCAHMGQFAGACLRTSGEWALAIVDTTDVLSLADSARVDSLRRTR
jgi:hypothetical protein